MLLRAFLLATVASMMTFMSVTANPIQQSFESMDIQPIDRIPWLEEFDDLNYLRSVPPDATLTTLELVSKYGYNGESHEVITSDGYILELHRITGRANSSESHVQKPVAFVMHGLLCSSAVWVLSGPEKGLAFLLADAGYDVWLGNARGNVYSRKHTSWSVIDKEFWGFSWHEIGTHDLPAMIDHILKITGQENLFYLAHSQGTTSFFAMASERPAYQKKIKAMFAMAPVAYCGRMYSPIFQILARFVGPMDVLLKLLGQYEFDPSSDAMKMFEQTVCGEHAITNPLCANVLFLISGFNKEQFDKALLPVILGHVPAGAATKQFVHYAQLIKSGVFVSPGRFKTFDYGILENKKIYGSFIEPSYNLRSIQVPISLHYSTNDWLANERDVEKLYKELGNPYGKFRVPDKDFNHLDYMWAKDVKELLYYKILSLMTNFRD